MNQKHLIATIAASAIGLAAVGGTSAVIALEDEYDHDTTAALEAAISPAEALAMAESDTGGRVIELEFENEDGVTAYELEIVMPDGSVGEMLLDATTGELTVYVDDDDDSEDDD